jgi:hypothetical protein
MRVKALVMVVPMLAALLPVGVAGASPGRYWLDVCHAGHPEYGFVDEVVDDTTGYGLTCSADPWVQGYGGRGVDGWLYGEVWVRDREGQRTGLDYRFVRPTGARVVPADELPPGHPWQVVVSRDGYEYVRSVETAGSSPDAPHLASPTGADLVNERVYFRCAGDDPLLRVDNLNGETHYSGAVIGWDTNAPTRTLVEGGCGLADPGLLKGGPNMDASFAGTFTGNLDVMTVEAYVTCADAGCRALGEVPVDVRLWVDGHQYVDRPAAGGSVTVTPVTGDGGVTLLRFSVVGLGLISEDDQVERAVHLELGTYFRDSADVWLYDAIEAPAGIEFNPDIPADAVVQL